MSSLSSLFGRDQIKMPWGKKDSSSALARTSLMQSEEKEDEDEGDLYGYGISLSHLINLPIAYTQAPLSMVRRFAMERAKSVQGSHKSYAEYLRQNPKTRHLVSKDSTIFVSYSPVFEIKHTLDALAYHFRKSTTKALDQVFVWIDFFCANPTRKEGIEFEEFASSFKSMLSRMSSAILVPFPCECAQSIVRAWSCFEWAVIAETGIPYDYCLVPFDAKQLSNTIKDGSMGWYALTNSLQDVNVEKAKAMSIKDQANILKYITKVGTTRVNQVMVSCLRRMLIDQAEISKAESLKGTRAYTFSCMTCGHMQQMQNKYDEAGLQFQDALSSARRSQPPDQEMIGSALILLSSLANVQGDYWKAEELGRQSLELFKTMYGENNSSVADRMVDLASALQMQGNRNEEMEALLEKSYSIRLALFGADHVDVANSLDWLSMIKFNKGQAHEALRMERESLEINIRTYGPGSVIVATLKRNHGWTLQLTGNYQEAERFYKESLAVQMRVHGEDHPDVARGMNGLSFLRQEQKQYEEAEQLSRRALEIRLKTYGPNHATVAEAYNNLGFLFEEMNQYQASEDAYKECLRITETIYGQDGHSDAAIYDNNFARLLRKLSRLDEAYMYNSRALKNLLKGYSEACWYYAMALNESACIQRMQVNGPSEEAQAKHDRAIKVLVEYQTIDGLFTQREVREWNLACQLTPDLRT